MTAPTIDRVSQAAAVFFAVAFLAMVAGLVQSMSTQAPVLRVIMMAFLALLFGSLAVLQLANARSRLVIEDDKLSRTGPLGWSLPRDQIVDARLVSGRATVLIVVVAQHVAKRSGIARAISWSWWLQPSLRARNTIATRVPPTAAPQISAHLKLD